MATCNVTTILPGSDYGRSRGCVVWLSTHGIAARDTYRVDVDWVHKTATIHQYECNEHGQHIMSPDEQIVTRDPFTVWLHTLPAVGED